MQELLSVQIDYFSRSQSGEATKRPTTTKEMQEELKNINKRQNQSRDIGSELSQTLGFELLKELDGIRASLDAVLNNTDVVQRELWSMQVFEETHDITR